MSHSIDSELFWRELRSLTEQVGHHPEKIDHLVWLLLEWPKKDRSRALHYAQSKLARHIVGPHELTLSDILTWCMQGHAPLRAHLERFHEILDDGVQRWVSVFAWACVLTQVHGVSMDYVQVTTSFEVSGHEAMRKIYLMTSHTMDTYVLDVHQGAQSLCMGIVNKMRWPGFEQGFMARLSPPTHLTEHNAQEMVTSL